MPRYVDKENRAILAARLREAREYLELSQDRAAGQMQMCRPTLVGIELGNRSVTATELARFSLLYRRPTWWLLGQQEPQQEDLLSIDTTGLSEQDQSAVFNFAEFLRHAAKAASQTRSSAECEISNDPWESAP